MYFCNIIHLTYRNQVTIFEQTLENDEQTLGLSTFTFLFLLFCCHNLFPLWNNITRFLNHNYVYIWFLFERIHNLKASMVVFKNKIHQQMNLLSSVTFPMPVSCRILMLTGRFSSFSRQWSRTSGEASSRWRSSFRL